MKLTQVLETSQESDPAECSTEWTDRKMGSFNIWVSLRGIMKASTGM